MKYVIGFPIKDDHVLLIKRNKHPWVNKWNGAGGKLEQGETPFQALHREFLEETTIDLKEAQQTQFTGIVTWDINKEGDNNTGMYAFISHLSNKQSLWYNERPINEGVLAWKPLRWVCDKSNTEVADNIPYFLPLMMKTTKHMRYHCVFRNNVLKDVRVLPLSDKIV